MSPEINEEIEELLDRDNSSLESQPTLIFDDDNVNNESASDDDDNVIDESASDDTVIPQAYNITSFGADYDVEGLYRRLERKEVFIPPFQRDYVWKMAEASRFIESLLLGLPVPGIFLAREPETNKLLVIDGQQRLKTLQFFFNGFFNPKFAKKKQRVFSLLKVQQRFEGLTYETLEEKDRITLDNSIIHATIVKQESPDDNDTSIYHIFERLNNGGRKLTPQEIRAALYHGDFVDEIKVLNDYSFWRQIYGAKSNRLKDQELILRFFALYYGYENYEKPMAEFISKFIKKRKNADAEFISKSSEIFRNTINIIYAAFGDTAFRPERSLNAAVFDSLMVGIARRAKEGVIKDSTAVLEAYNQLYKDKDYQIAVSAATSDERNVIARIGKSISAFAAI